MPDGLKSRTLHGLFWSFFDRTGQQGIQFIISIILARLLAPEEFGLVAMLAVFMAIAQAFVGGGFGAALIHKADTGHVDECSVFYFNILVGFLAAGVLCLAAPGIAAFYKRPILVPLTRALSLNLIINSFGIIQSTLLTKRLDFKAQMKISLMAAFFSGLIGVSMAYRGYGVWSLVAQSLSSTFLQTLLLWVFFPWRPVWAFSVASLRGMFPFGSKLLCASVIATLFDNMYQLVIGKVFSAADLGFYQRAKGFQQLPVDNITSSVWRVTFPVFSSVKDDKARLKRGVRKALTTMAMVNFPLMIGLAIVAKPLVHVLLTDKWAPCVPYLQLLCMAGLLYPLHAININVLTSQGRTDLNLRIAILKDFLRVALLAVTFRFGIAAIIYGQIAQSVLCYFVNTYYTAVLIRYSVWEQILDLSPYLGTAGVMGVGVCALQYVITGNAALLLAAQVGTGLLLFTALCCLFRPQPFVELWQMLRQKLRQLRYGA